MFKSIHAILILTNIPQKIHLVILEITAVYALLYLIIKTYLNRIIEGGIFVQMAEPELVGSRPATRSFIQDSMWAQVP